MAEWRQRLAVARTRARYYVPVLRWLPKYNVRNDIWSDISAGITVALLIIPQSLSYASGLAKLEPIVGLYTCFGSLLLYGVLGTSRQLSVGPEALVSLLIGSAVSQPLLNETSPPTLESRMERATLLSLLVGLITFVLGLARLGFVDSVLSRALLRGFITAVACVILIEQLPALLGLQAALLTDQGSFHRQPSEGTDLGGESPFHKLQLVFRHVAEINWVTTAISICSVSFLFGFQRLKRSIQQRIERISLAVDGTDPFYRSLPQNDGAINDYENNETNGGALINEYHGDNSMEELSDDDNDDDDDDNDNDDDDNDVVHQAFRSSNRFPQSFRAFLAQRRALNSSSQVQTAASRRKLFYLRLLYHIPEILIVVLCTVLISWACQLHSRNGVAILGEASMKSGFMLPRFPTISLTALKSLITPAILISVLGFVESIVAAKDFASKYNYSVSANRELVAFGVLNIIGSALSAFPAFSSIARSRVNDTAGAKTQMAGIITGAFILITILFMLPVFYYLPKAVMASIVLVAATGLLEMHDVWFMLRIRAWKDLALAALTFLTTIFWSVEAGTLISISLSLVMVVKHSTTPKLSVLGRVVEFDAIDQQPKVKYRPLQELFATPDEQRQQQLHLEDQDILIVRVEEALFFGNTGQLKDRLRRAEAYGGWLHIHPSEDERRPVESACSNDGGSGERNGRKGTETQHGRMSQSNGAGRQTSGSPTSSLDKSAIALPRVSADNISTTRQHCHTYRPPALRAVIFDIENMTAIDASAIQILIEIIQDYQRRDIQVFFVKLREINKSLFLRSGLLGDLLGSDHFFRKITDAVAYLRSTLVHKQTTDSDTIVPDGENGMGEAAQSFSTYNIL